MQLRKIKPELLKTLDFDFNLVEEDIVDPQMLFIKYYYYLGAT